jgi:hypothetical protein
MMASRATRSTPNNLPSGAKTVGGSVEYNRFVSSLLWLLLVDDDDETTADDKVNRRRNDRRRRGDGSSTRSVAIMIEINISYL